MTKQYRPKTPQLTLRITHAGMPRRFDPTEHETVSSGLVAQGMRTVPEEGTVAASASGSPIHPAV
ncbi:MAG: hypothetical protein NVSMB62_28490 [Acidobacteriaceae bacterium]